MRLVLVIPVEHRLIVGAGWTRAVRHQQVDENRHHHPEGQHDEEADPVPTRHLGPAEVAPHVVTSRSSNYPDQSESGSTPTTTRRFFAVYSEITAIRADVKHATAG